MAQEAKYEVVREWDATCFGPGIGFTGFVEREEIIGIGYDLVPREGEFRDELEKELLTGKVDCVFKKGDYKNPESGSDFRIGLEGIVNVPELAKKYGKSENDILDNYLHLSSEGRKKVLEQCSGSVKLLDDIYYTEDSGQVGVIWKTGGDFVVYNYQTGKILGGMTPGLGIRYGNCGKRDFLAVIGKRSKYSNGKLYLKDIVDAMNAIKDWDYYHYEDD